MADRISPLPSSVVPLILARDAPNTTRAVRSGELVCVLRGVYTPADLWARLAPWDRYLARVDAASMRYPDAVLALESAAAKHGMAVFGDPGVVHLLGDGHATSRVSDGVQFHTTTQARVISAIGGVAVTSIADTAVDIARLRHNAVGLAMADAAMRLETSITVEQLVALNESRATSRGRRRARWVVHRASPLPETALESVSRAAIEWLGFPEPELQIWIGSDRVDAWWRQYRIAGEGDGDLKYDGRYGDASDALRKRHQRDGRLFDNGAQAVPHWGWPEVIAVDPLHAILTSAGLPVIRTREHAPLLSLRRILQRPR